MRPWIFLLIIAICVFGGRANADLVPILDASGQKAHWQGPEEVFRTYDLSVRVTEDQSVIVSSRTNYPQSLVPADLFFKKDGAIVLAVKMGDGRIIRYPDIMSSFFLAQEGLAARYVDGSYIPVQARRGNALSKKVTISWRKNPSGEGCYLVKVKIPPQSFQEGGKYKVVWGTAPCGNSPAEAEFVLIFPEGGWGPGGPAGYIPPTGSSVTGVPYYAGICSSGGSSGGGGGGGNSPEYPLYPPPLFPPPPYLPPTPPPPPIPIPGTMMLLGSGLIGLFFWRRKA